MAAVWSDRLAEVWAPPGKAGTGFVLGDDTVVTARHLLAGASAGEPVLARVVRPGALAAAGWVPMRVTANDEAWDIAILRPDPASSASPPVWLRPGSPSPALVRLGTAAEPDCEAVGFPQSEVRPAARANAVIRQTEQVRGVLSPAGQAKAQAYAGQVVPRRLVPLDIDSPTPVALRDWAGMSGAGVVLPDGRLAGTVVRAEADHQLRRLYVVLMADILDQSGRLAGALSDAFGSQVVAEARTAPMYQSVLRDSCIAGDGLPVTVSGASLQAFGVRAAGLPDEPEYLHYVSRDADQGLREAMQTAREDSRLLLVIGASASGKSRSAAEAVRNLFGRYRLLCPQHAALSRLPELPLGEVSPALVWLDDLERYDERALKDTVVTLRRSGVTVVATMRRGELRARTPDSGRRSPLAEALADTQLVAQFPWPTNWSAGERDALAGLVQNPSLRAAARDTVSPSAWVVAGPALQRRLDDARTDDERPARYALIQTVLDWYRTGTAQTIARDTAIMLLRKYLPDGVGPVASDDIDDAFTWAFGSVLDTARTTRQSLLTATPDGGGLLVHDYIQDRDAESQREAIPDSVLAAALGQEGTDEARLAIGDTARAQGSDSVAFAAFFPPRPLDPSRTGNDAFAAPRTGTPRAGSGGAQRNHPYRGLMPFSEADAEVFYGRDQVTAELARRLERDGPVIVTGPSGAGKSSLLRAGLLPTLARGEQIAGSDRWPRIVIEPGQRPLAELADKLSTLTGRDAEGILRELDGDPGQARTVFQEARAAVRARHGADGTARLVLIVDQFEQTFTLGGQDAAAERRAFITAVCSAAAQADGPGSQPPAAVILAVRGDFIDQMAASPELAAALQHGMFVVPPMDGRELLEAVTGPAAAAGLQIEPALAERVAADITNAASGGTTSGLLPLLSQAMLLTWENREGDKLTLRGYELAGGITLAVQVSADNAYNALNERQQALAPYVIRAMTVRTSDGHLIRRPAIRAELDDGRPTADEEDIDAVLAELASRRLVVLNGATVELAHDIIITAWPRLRAWLDEEQASMLTYGTLAADAGQWQARGRSRDYLYAGARLTTVQAAASHWAEEPARLPGLSAVQREFIQASSRYARRRNRVRQAAVAALTAMVLVAAASAFVAFNNRQVAIDDQRAVVAERDAAASGQLADKSENFTSADTAVAAQLAAAAWQISPTTEAQQAMQSIVTKAGQVILPRATVLPGSPGDFATAAVFSPDGKILVVATIDGVIRLFNVATGQQIGPPLVSAGAPVEDGQGVVAFSPDGSILAVSSARGIRLWNMVTRRLVAELPSSATVTAAVFSPDGSILAVGSADGVRLWNVATPGHVKQITEVPLGGRGAGSALTFSPDGRILAVGDSVGTAQLWDAATGRQIGLSLVAGNAPVTSVAFTRDGATLATANADGIARLWSTTTGNPIGGELPGGSKIYSVAFSPDGQTLATTGANGSASLWRLKYPGGSGSLLARVCAIADGSLTRSEWTQYVQGGIPFQHVCP